MASDLKVESQRIFQGYQAWLIQNFAEVAHHPLAERHHRLWRWFEKLGATSPEHQTPNTKHLSRSSEHRTPNTEHPPIPPHHSTPNTKHLRSPEHRTPNTEHLPRSRPRAAIEVWPRGGAKSATAELACAFLATRLNRRFVLYVSGTQSQADMHVQTIAGHLEHLKIDRALTRYGASKGWRRNQLRTREGFNVAAYGLDGASRGVKIGRYRPDLIIFDDIDSQADTPAVVRKKIDAISQAILPAGSTDCAVLFLQNLIHRDGVVSQLVDGRADFLLDREKPNVEPAVLSLQTEIAKSESGANVHAIVAGKATWEGQPIEVCEQQINQWGFRAFQREAQHLVHETEAQFFKVDRFQIVDDAPNLLRVCLAWDLAATEAGGDYTVAVLAGIDAAGIVYVLQVVRGQYSAETVRKLILKNANLVRNHFPNYTIRLPQDPGQAGKDQAEQLRRLLASHPVQVVPASGNKAVRAQGWAEAVNLGNVRLIRAVWNDAFIDEHRLFREDLAHEQDDQVDAASDVMSELHKPIEVRVMQTIRTNPAYQEW